MTDEKQLTIPQIIGRLVGPVQPVGEHYEDERRLENIKELAEVAHFAISELYDAAKNADRVENSMMLIGEEAKRAMSSLGDYFEDMKSDG